MGKRKHKDRSEDGRRHIQHKIRRLEKRLERYTSASDYEDGNDNDHYYHTRPSTPQLPSDVEFPTLALSDSDESNVTNLKPSAPLSMVIPVTGDNQKVLRTDSPIILNMPPNSATAEPVINTEVPTPTLPAEILEALGDPKIKEEVFGPSIPEEISKRWGRVLTDGLTKEQKQELSEKHHIPDNFRLVKAPLLNPEIIPVLNEVARSRDKLMEKSQNQLGQGISGLTNLASAVIKEDLSKVEILKKISEVSQIFLDLHYQDTTRRRKLITGSLDKKFLNMISDVKRDTYLFGTNLGEKIKATKTAERSGLQIKRTETITSFPRKYAQQGNWRGPPPTQGQRTHRGGHKPRYVPSQRSRRPPPPRERAPGPATKTNNAKSQKQ